MRRVSILVIVILIALAAAAPSAQAAHCGSRGATYAEALKAKAAARAAAERAARRAAARAREERFIARETARYIGLYGRRVGRWYPLVHRYFPGYERDALFVMRGESGGDRKATNGFCWSLWQLNQCHARKFREVTGHAFFWGVFVPRYSAEMTAYMTRGGRDWSAWSIRP